MGQGAAGLAGGLFQGLAQGMQLRIQQKQKDEELKLKQAIAKNTISLQEIQQQNQAFFRNALFGGGQPQGGGTPITVSPGAGGQLVQGQAQPPTVPQGQAIPIGQAPPPGFGPPPGPTPAQPGALQGAGRTAAGFVPKGFGFDAKGNITAQFGPPPKGTPQMQNFRQALGAVIDPKHPKFGFYMGLLQQADLLSPEVRNFRIQNIIAVAQADQAQAGLAQPSLARPARGAVPGPALAQPQRRGAAAAIGVAREQARATKIAGTMAVETAKIQAQIAAKPLPTETGRRLEAFQSAHRAGMAAFNAFVQNPNLVGKGFLGTYKRDLAADRKKANAAGRLVEQGGTPSPDMFPGAIAGALRQFLGRPLEGEVILRRSLLEMADSILRARSGAQINEQEFARIMDFLARLTDEPTVFGPALERALNAMLADMKGIVKTAITPGPQVLQELQQIQPVTAPALQQRGQKPPPPKKRFSIP